MSTANGWPLLDLRHLRMLATVAEQGSLTAAAKRLFLTQSALSHQLKELEGIVGGPVFFRQGRRMTLTPAGRRLRDSAERVLAELAAARHEVARLVAGEIGELRLSTGCYTCYHWLPRLLPGFHASHPGVEVRLVPEHTEAVLDALKTHRIDMAIVDHEPLDPLLKAEPLFADEMVVLVAPGHRLADREAVGLDDLDGEHLLVHGGGRDRIEEWLSQGGMRPGKTTELKLSEAILEWVAVGLGVTVMAHWAARRHLELGMVRALRLKGRRKLQRWLAVTLEGARPAYVDTLIELVRAHPPTLEPVT